MSEKKSHLPGEKAFGGAIPEQIAKEFKVLVRTAGWNHKRAIAAAIFALLKAAKSSKDLHESEAAKWYSEVASFYATPPAAGGDVRIDHELLAKGLKAMAAKKPARKEAS
jgi:hypothetical protein